MKRFFLLFALIGLIVVAAGIFLVARQFFGSEAPATELALPYVQNFDDLNLRPWYINDGVWTIRDEALLQTVGGETPGQIHVPYALPQDQPYHLSSYITLKRDTKAAGVAFNSQLPNLIDQQHRVFISRSRDGQMELVAGYMNEVGSFVPQAKVPLPADLSEFRLDLFVYENSYLVQLNGQRLIEKRPLFYKNGLTGFYSIGSVIFDSLKITVADNVNPDDQVYISDFDQEPGGAGWVPFSGEWRVSDGQMTQNDPNAYDTGIAYETGVYENYVVQALFEHTQGVGAGLLFNMPSPYQINGAHVVRYSDETDALVWGYYDAQGAFVRQGFADIAPPGNLPHQLQVFSGADSYDIFLDDQLVARDVTLQQSQGSIGLTTSRSAAGFSLVEVFPLFGTEEVGLRQLTPVTSEVEDTIVVTPSTDSAIVTPAVPLQPTLALAEATPLPENGAVVTGGADGAYRGNFTGDFQSSGWLEIRGDWRFENGNLVQADPDGFDFSAVQTNQAYRNYSLQVTFNHLQGHGGGVLFNMPFSDRLNGAHLVRYSDRRPGAIFWGYYNTDGQFVGQGYADVPEAGNAPHSLRIISEDSTYGIFLDGNLIASDLPLQQSSGYIGLLTAQSAAAFSQIIVDAPEVEPLVSSATEVQDGFNNPLILSGRWITEGNQTIQEVPEEGDYILNLGTTAAVFEMEAEIILPEDSNAGGGFIFHMPDSGSRRNAHITRLINGGKGVFWGTFDENSVFQGVGSTAIDETGSTYLLRLEVERDVMSLTVNGESILQNYPLDRQEGWLGLIAFGGPVTFTDLKVEIKEQRS